MSYIEDFARGSLPRTPETAARELAAQFAASVAAGEIAPGSPAAAIVWAVSTVEEQAEELKQLRRELKRFGDLPCEAAFYADGPGREPEQLMFRRPDGRLVVLIREGEPS